MTVRGVLLVTLVALLGVGTPAQAGLWNPGPGRRLRPKASNTDAMLFAKAMRVQSRMWAHISPEGLLVYEHTQGATPDRLSHDVLSVSDAAMWTGCYAGAQACRWHVTRDPDALNQVRIFLSGLFRMAHVTGTPGRLCRSFGRVHAGLPTPPNLRAAAGVPGQVFQDDISRDQLAGVVLGLSLMLRFVPEPDVQAGARNVLAVIATQLDRDGMWLRTSTGAKAKYGELRADVEYLPMVKNGALAAIGYAPFAVMAAQGHAHLSARKRRYDELGWRRALPEQHTWLSSQMSMSNVNMLHVALVPTVLFGDAGARRNALAGLRALRKRTRGWWNGGYAAMQLLAGNHAAQGEALDELRTVLHMMTEEEIPAADVPLRRPGRIATIRERGVVDWAWKIHVDGVRIPRPDSPPHPTLTYTRADWLFAYWLARAAGHLRPSSGPGAQAVPPPCPVTPPAWLQTALPR